MDLSYITLYFVIGLVLDVILTIIDRAVIAQFIIEGHYINLLIGQILTIILWPVAVLLRFYKKKE